MPTIPPRGISHVKPPCRGRPSTPAVGTGAGIAESGPGDVAHHPMATFDSGFCYRGELRHERAEERSRPGASKIRPRRAAPSCSERPRSLQVIPRGDPQRQIHAAASDLLAGKAEEVGRGHGFLEHDQHRRRGAMVCDGAFGGVVPQVGSEAGGHRGGVERAPLPFEEERPFLTAAPQDAEGVGVDRAQRPAMAEIARRAVRRV